VRRERRRGCPPPSAHCGLPAGPVPNLFEFLKKPFGSSSYAFFLINLQATPDVLRNFRGAQ
jgi:hypothetical protein